MDIPLSLKQALSNERQSHTLLMKSKGYTKAIISVCQSLDTNLQTIFNDLNLYLNPDAMEIKKNDQSNTSDHAEIIHFLQESSREGVSELITTIKSCECKQTQATFIALATLLKAITELCPNLRLCIFQHSTTWTSSSSSSLAKTTSSNQEQWESVCQLLDEESLRFWQQWIDLFVADITTGYPHFIDEVDFITMTKDLLSWEVITIEENDEQDQPIQSTIRVPAHPSVSLQQFFHVVCTKLNQIVPYTLRRIVTTMLTEQLMQRLDVVYTRYSNTEFVRGNQNISLQYYFDLKFIHTTLVVRENKRAVEKLQTLSNQFKSNIDPFDFELFHKYIVVNVKKSAQRMQVILSVFS